MWARMVDAYSGIEDRGEPVNRRFVLVLMIALIGAACGGDDTAATTASPEPTAATTEPPEPTAASGPESRPATPVSAVLDDTGFGRVTGEFDASVMGVEPGSVTAEWFRAEGFYVVYFEGFDAVEAGSICPGALVDSPEGDFWSVAPTGDTDECKWFGPIPRRGADGARPLECGTSLAYRTFIPDDTIGTLKAELSRTVGEGVMFISGEVDSQAGETPDVDISIFEC